MTAWQIIGLCFMAVYPILFAMRDGVTYATNFRKYHNLAFIERAMFGVVSLQAFWPGVEFFLWLMVSGVWFWIVFDIVWNWTAHHPLFYVGQTAFLDVKLGKKIYAVKLILLVTSIVLLIIVYK